MSDDAVAQSEASPSHDGTLLGMLVRIVLIVALVFALRSIFSPYSRVVP